MHRKFHGQVVGQQISPGKASTKEDRIRVRDDDKQDEEEGEKPHTAGSIETRRPCHRKPFEGALGVCRANRNNDMSMKINGPQRETCPAGSCSRQSTRWLPAGTATAEKAIWAGTTWAARPSTSTLR